MCPSNCAPATGGSVCHLSSAENNQKKNPAEAGLSKNGRGTGIRTPEWRDQNPLPYRLAIPLQKFCGVILYELMTILPLNLMAGVQGFEPQNGGIKTRCLTAWLHPCRNCRILTCFGAQRDSNSYASRHWNLNPVRLPISPLPHTLDYPDNKVVATAGIEPATQHYECCALTS